MTEFEEVEIVDLDPRTTTGKFRFAEGFDFKTVLATLSETNSHIKGWSVTE